MTTGFGGGGAAWVTTGAGAWVVVGAAAWVVTGARVGAAWVRAGVTAGRRVGGTAVTGADAAFLCGLAVAVRLCGAAVEAADEGAAAEADGALDGTGGVPGDAVTWAAGTSAAVR